MTPMAEATPSTAQQSNSSSFNLGLEAHKIEMKETTVILISLSHSVHVFLGHLVWGALNLGFF